MAHFSSSVVLGLLVLFVLLSAVVGEMIIDTREARQSAKEQSDVNGGSRQLLHTQGGSSFVLCPPLTACANVKQTITCKSGLPASTTLCWCCQVKEFPDAKSCSLEEKGVAHPC
ncbi:hypothetical protein O6H91_09G047900 [Diphasiastrum complanatum]|uniref:Uncharacterized protein n=1 Tax=Diphasiastrum complanatum TaxID=34168 RepID=A0ACC2CPX8_DIPCM|nr:hypothetical protein O6H91_09G047900 [Diphasiastrum complanatum]